MLRIFTEVTSLLTVYLCLLMGLNAIIPNNQQIPNNQYYYYCHIMFKIKLIKSRGIRCTT